MTTHDELRAFARALALTCHSYGLVFACLHSESNLELAPRPALAPYLYLARVAEELACGHIVPTSQGRNLFIRVRTPFAASSSLWFVTLRTYSLILVTQRSLKISRFERDLSPAAAHADPGEILARAAEAVTRSPFSDQAFLQPEQSAPFPTKHPELLAFRATFCSGTEVGTVLPSSPDTTKAAQLALAPNPAKIYLL